MVPLVLLLFLHCSDGQAPQPEQIHISATGRQSEIYLAFKIELDMALVYVTSCQYLSVSYVSERLLH